jgi:hypothetical protein
VSRAVRQRSWLAIGTVARLRTTAIADVGVVLGGLDFVCGHRSGDALRVRHAEVIVQRSRELRRNLVDSESVATLLQPNTSSDAQTREYPRMN